MRFRTRAIHVGNSKDAATGAVVPPIHVASTYVQPSAGEWGEFDYSRSGNPTRSRLEETICSLEGAQGALTYASGMAAIHGAVMMLSSGDHLIAGSDIYGGTYRLLHHIVNRSGIETTLVDSTDLQAIRDAARPETKMLWIESPGNPRMTISNLDECASLAKENGWVSVADNTFATPVLNRPIESGFDIVIHSATKYLGGHSDALGGITAVADRSTYDRLYYIQNATGAVMSPWDSFLISRGLKTLDLRVRAQCDAAERVASFLAQDARIKYVYYPGLAAHPQHELARRQMDGKFGAMLSFETQGGFEQAKAVVNATRLFQLAVSLGAVESLIEQPASMSHASYAAEDRARHGISDSMIRLSVGLEDPSDLIDDLAQALDGAAIE